MTGKPETHEYAPPPERSSTKKFLFTIAESLAWILLIPMFLMWKSSLFRYHSLAIILCLIPTNIGVIFRRVWYRQTLRRCGKFLVVEFLGWIRTDKTEIGDNVYIGINSWVGLARIGNDVMVSGAVKIISGLRQHNMYDLTMPMKNAGGTDTRVVIGNDVWIGVGAIVGADVADASVVAAGAVVTKSTQKGDIFAGVPAKRIGNRFSIQDAGKEE